MEFILAIIATLVILNWIRNSFKRGSRQRRRSSSKASGPVDLPALVDASSHYEWSDGGSFSFEIVGEANYQSTLRRLVGSENAARGDSLFTAKLVPEDGNAYDDKAVGVYIGGQKVGHLSRQDARSFRRRLGAKRLTGRVTTCPATIFGGRVVDGETQALGVWLDLKPFE